jgi:uncharacterized membrane protein YidH (DUF202 family)
MTQSQGPWDPGLQNERTTLAWSRTAMSMVAVAALTAKQSRSPVFAGIVLLAVLLAATAIVMHADRRHHVRTEQLRSGTSVSALAEVATTTVIAVALAACSLVVAVI